MASQSNAVAVVGAAPRRSRKDDILDVATRLFAERGYDGASMNDVAGRVGVRKASLFYHFATKDALYEAVLARLLARIAQSLATVYAQQGAFADRVDRAADIITVTLAEHPYAARLLLREAMDWGPVMRGKLHHDVLDVLEAAAMFLRAGQQAGEVVDGDPKHMVMTAIGAYCLPFAIGELLEKFTGQGVFDARFVSERRAALRRHLHDMIVKR